MAHLGYNCIELLVMQKKKPKKQTGQKIIVAVNLLSTGKLGTDASLLGYYET